MSRRKKTSRPTAADVAREAGISQSAVSRAFTPGASVAQSTRHRVLEAARKLKYRPNALARSLTTQRSRIIAVAMTQLDNPFYPSVLQSLSRLLQARGYQILLFTAPQGEAADPLFESVMRYQVDGIILASTMLSSALARECRGAGVPVVLFNRTTNDTGMSSVAGDNEAGGAAIAAFLHAGGHRRYAFMAGLEDSSTSRDRERGFRTALKELGVAEISRAVGRYTREDAAEATRALLHQEQRPDAIFCANDHMAIACMEVARMEFGLNIPRDLSIVGFDDAGMASAPTFDITTYSQPFAAMAAATVSMLSDLMDAPDQPPRRCIVGGELIVRSSARRPPR